MSVNIKIIHFIKVALQFIVDGVLISCVFLYNFIVDILQGLSYLDFAKEYIDSFTAIILCLTALFRFYFLIKENKKRKDGFIEKDTNKKNS